MSQRVRKGILAFTAWMLSHIFFFLSPGVIVLSAVGGVVNGSAIDFVLSQKR
jgi:hypothetical protein